MSERPTTDQVQAELYDKGHEAGDAWALETATSEELARLEAFRKTIAEWSAEMTKRDGGFDLCERAFFALEPAHDGDTDEARAFWEIAGVDLEQDIYEAPFAVGFIDGAIAAASRAKLEPVHA